MFLKVAGIFQFDINFYGRAYDIAILAELVRRGVIGVEGYYYYRLQHSTDAAYIIEAEAIIRAKKEPAIVTTEILTEYLQRKPENYYELMKALFISKERCILAEIFNNQKTYYAIFDIVKQGHIRVVSYVLSYLTWACGKDRGLEFWSQYKKLGGDSLDEQKEKLKSKLTEASLTEVYFLLYFLNKVDFNERVWLANKVLNEDDLVQKAEDMPFSTINNLMRLLPNEKTSAILSKLDPNDIAEKAKLSSAQDIMWFLKYCSRDPSNIKFVKAFLLAINKGALIEKLKNSELSITLDCLSIIKPINPDLHEEVKSKLAPYWMQLWLSSSLSVVARQLYRYRRSIGEPKEFARTLVNNLASLGLSEPISKLYGHPETNPLKVLGKLLDTATAIAFETDTDAVEKIAQQIVNNIDFKAQETYDPEQLSLLVHNTKKCNEMAWVQLCSRILSELNVTDYISIPFDKGSAFLVWEIYQYDEEKGQELANEIFELDFNKLLDSSDLESVKTLLWNLLKINESEARSWIQNMDDDKYLSKVLSYSTHDAFWLLWNLYQVDEEKGKNVAQSLANNVLSGLTVIDAKDIPLLGFFVFCNIKLDLNIPIPSPCEIAEEIIKNQSLAELAFCLCFLEKEDNALRKEFLKELGRRFFLNNLTFPAKEMIEKHPIENTRHLLMEIFTSFDLPKEPDSTFVEMIRLTKAYLEEKKETKVAFSQLQDFFLRNPTNNPIFKSVEDSNKWLNVAIQYGIYDEEERVPHHKNLLSLREDIGLFYHLEGE